MKRDIPELTQETIEQMNWWLRVYELEVERVVNVLNYFQKLKGY